MERGGTNQPTNQPTNQSTNERGQMPHEARPRFVVLCSGGRLAGGVHIFDGQTDRQTDRQTAREELVCLFVSLSVSQSRGRWLYVFRAPVTHVYRLTA